MPCTENILVNKTTISLPSWGLYPKQTKKSTVKHELEKNAMKKYKATR